MNMSIPKMNKNAIFANIFINSRVPLAEHIVSAKRIYRVSTYRAEGISCDLRRGRNP